MSDVMEFDVSVVDDIDQGSVERTEGEFPTIQWHRGDPKMKRHGGMDFNGGWFIAESQAPADLTQFGWEKVTWTHSADSETDGYYKRDLVVSAIRERRRWEVFQEKGNTRTLFAWNDYDAAAKTGRCSGRSHTLVLIKDLEAFGPFILTLRGMAGVYFYNRKNSPKSALGTFDGIVVKAANDKVKASGRKALMPRRAFWLTVGASRKDNGEPMFIEVGTGSDKSFMVVPTALNVPDKAEKVDLGQFFLGRDLLNQASTLWNETADWAKAWDNIVPGAVEGGDGKEKAAALPVTAGKPVSEATEEAVAELGF